MITFLKDGKHGCVSGATPQSIAECEYVVEGFWPPDKYTFIDGKIEKRKTFSITCNKPLGGTLVVLFDGVDAITIEKLPEGTDVQAPAAHVEQSGTSIKIIPKEASEFMVVLSHQHYHTLILTCQAVDRAALCADQISKLKEVRDAALSGPVVYGGVEFDGDADSKRAIFDTSTYINVSNALPNSWLGWRDAKNEFQWVGQDVDSVKMHLEYLYSAIEQKNQEALATYWLALDALNARPIHELLAERSM